MYVKAIICELYNYANLLQVPNFSFFKLWIIASSLHTF